MADLEEKRSKPEPCKHCGGNGYSGGVMPSIPDLCGEYDGCCEVCLGTGLSRTQGNQNG